MKVQHSRWDDSDFIVSLLPSWEKPWRDVPVGPVLSERDAKVVAEWLQAAWPEVARMAKAEDAEKPDA